MDTDTREIRGVNKWLQNDEEMISWVREKLIEEGIIKTAFVNAESQYDQLNDLLIRTAKNPETRAIVRQIRSKWSLEKHNKNPNNQKITMTLHPNTVYQLDHLKIGNSRRDTIEKLVAWAKDTKSEVKKIFTEEKKAKLAELERQWPSKKDVVERVRDDNKLEELEEIIKVYWEHLELFIRDRAALEVLHPDFKVNEFPTAKQLEDINEATKHRMEYYSTNITIKVDEIIAAKRKERDRKENEIKALQFKSSSEHEST